MKIGPHIDLDLSVGTDGKVRMRLTDLRKTGEAASGSIPLTQDDVRVVMLEFQRALRMASALNDPTEK